LFCKQHHTEYQPYLKQLTYLNPFLAMKFAFCSIGLFTIALVTSAQKREMTIIDFLNIPSVQNPILSPKGDQYLFVMAESNWKENKQVGHIWRGDIKNGTTLKLTRGENGESSPKWSPDGNIIAFISKRPPQEESQIYLINNGGGEARLFTKHKTSVQNIQWAPDGKSIYFTAADAKTAEELKKEKLRDDVFAYDENYKHTHLWRMQLTDTAAVKITDGNYSINGYALSNKGDKIVVLKGSSPLLTDNKNNELWVMDKDGKSQVAITSNTIAEQNPEFSPDGNTILFQADVNEKLEPYYNNKVFTVSAAGGNIKLITKDFLYDVTEAHWANDGKSIYLLCNTGLESQLFLLTLNNLALTVITKGSHSIGNWNYNDLLDQHIVSLANEKNVGDLHLIKGKDAKTDITLTQVYNYLDNEFILPKQERVSWYSQDGQRIEGLLFYPNQYEATKKYPLIVQTHGGPAASDKFGLSRGITHYHPVLTAKGYFVLLPNYRGSTGYGDPFLRDMVGAYFRNAHLDVMAGVDYLVSRGLVDPDKLIKMGWSAGGHMTNKLITFTDRFKAASSGAGAANWISMYAQSDTRYYRTPWFGGTPWQKDAPIENYWNNSPLKEVAKVKTPTLFIVGGSDVRVPLAQSVEMYQALKANGIPTHLYVAPREPHGWSELRHRLYKINVELDWFSNHVFNKSYTWETAPEKN
jgi:dipeptidyl aminopeptidase/acylaminoacyl peptidase